MDLLSFINHLQKKVSSGGASKRVHGIGQGHDASVADVLAGDPSADIRIDAAPGYMNADMLDGYHAKQVYQEKVPGLYSGLNADTLDGVDKSLGHVVTDALPTPAWTRITFSGIPKQTDVVTLKLYGPNGTQIGSNVTANISQAIPTLEDVRTAVKNAITTDASVLAAFTNNGTDSNSTGLTLTTAQKGPRANLYVLVVTVTNVAQSTLAVDKTHGVYRFKEGGPEEGINADKLDDLHARETYHNIAPPDGSGINADTLDGYHAVVPTGGTGKYIPRVLEGDLTGTFARDSFNPRLIGEGIKAPQSYGWLVSAGMFGGGSSGGTSYSGGIPEFVVSDITIDGTKEWAWVIRTFNDHPAGGSTSWDATSWQDESITPSERGYLRWVANGDKYLGTYVDRAAVAEGLVEEAASLLSVGTADISNAVSSGVPVIHSTSARRLYVYTVKAPYNDRDLFINVPGDPLLISVRNTNWTFNSGQGQLGNLFTGGELPPTIDTTPNLIADQDQGPNITWNDPDFDNVIQKYVYGDIGIFRDNENRVWLVIHESLLTGNEQTFVVSVVI